MKFKVLIIALFIALAMPLTGYAGSYTMCPDGSYVGGGTCTMTPDGSYVGGKSYTMTPDGNYVGGKSYTMTPDGSYVGGKSYTMTPDGSYVGRDGKSTREPSRIGQTIGAVLPHLADLVTQTIMIFAK
ncbi:MAG: hypothetical protein RX318_03285 [bacterium]|nr:hypothetical protein [bacterium]